MFNLTPQDNQELEGRALFKRLIKKYILSKTMSNYKIPTFEIVVNDDDDFSVYTLGLVENPAIQEKWVALSEEKEIKLATIEDKQILLGPVLIPNKKIYRVHNGQEFYIVFTEEAIKKLSEKYLKNSNHFSFNLEHNENLEVDAVVVESWIIENSEKDKSSNYGFDLPKGTWMVGVKVDDKTVWDKYIKMGRVKGFSIEANLGMKEINMEEIKMVEPKSGESEEEFISRCIPYMIGEGYEQSKASAICYSKWGQKLASERVSYDYDGVASTPLGKSLIMDDIDKGYEVYIISARNDKEGLMYLVSEVGVKSSNIYATGSNTEKINKIKELGIIKHYDNNPNVIEQLGEIGELFKLSDDEILELIDQLLKKKVKLAVSSDKVSKSIKDRQRVIMYYNGPDEGGKGLREVEPVCLGVSRAGNPVVRAWEIRGASASASRGELPLPSWRLFRLDRITTYALTNDFYNIPRPDFNFVGDRSMSSVQLVAEFNDVLTIIDVEKNIDNVVRDVMALIIGDIVKREGKEAVGDIDLSKAAQTYFKVYKQIEQLIRRDLSLKEKIKFRQQIGMLVKKYQDAIVKQIVQLKLAERTYTDYPSAAVENAKRALKWADENGWGSCGTPTGKRRAYQLANRQPISEETISRMASFERHRQYRDVPYDKGCGGLMWDAWGGTEGIQWAQRKLRQIQRERDFKN